MKNKSELQLTQTELELMNILWDIGEGSVRDIMGNLPAGRELAYTSVSTMIRILEKKGIVLSTKVGRGHLYRPLVERKDYEKVSVDGLIKNVFQGAPLSVVKCLIEDEKLSQQEIAELKSLLESK